MTVTCAIEGSLPTGAINLAEHNGDLPDLRSLLRYHGIPEDRVVLFSGGVVIPRRFRTDGANFGQWEKQLVAQSGLKPYFVGNSSLGHFQIGADYQEFKVCVLRSVHDDEDKCRVWGIVINPSSLTDDKVESTCTEIDRILQKVL